MESWDHPPLRSWYRWSRGIIRRSEVGIDGVVGSSAAQKLVSMESRDHPPLRSWYRWSRGIIRRSEVGIDGVTGSSAAQKLVSMESRVESDSRLLSMLLA